MLTWDIDKNSNKWKENYKSIILKSESVFEIFCLCPKIALDLQPPMSYKPWKILMSDNFLNPILVCKITTCVFSHIFLYKCINSVNLCKLILFVVMLCPFYFQNMAFSVFSKTYLQPFCTTSEDNLRTPSCGVY